MLSRRTTVQFFAASAWPLSAFAHHGWSSFDDATPLFLNGKAQKVTWANPHAEIMLDIAGTKLPDDLATRSLPKQSAPVDGADLLKRAKLPAKLNVLWEIELAPLTRLQAWQVAEIAAGTELAVLGYGLKDPKAKPVMRAEYLWVAGKTYALRSSPV